MTAYRAGVRDRSGPMKSVKIPDRSGELEPAMSDFFSRSHSSLHFLRLCSQPRLRHPQICLR